jgi:hydroxymethylbilane synthase
LGHNPTIVIGTRGSPLALWQANWVKSRFEEAGQLADLRVIKTSGDKLASAPLAESGVKGLFIKEIEEALAAGEIDVAVHSLKDLPVQQPEGLVIAAVPEREDARDALVCRRAGSLAQLPPGARVGTSSLRRQAQVLRLRPDLQIVALRGNLDTRLRKLDQGECEALVVAVAGMRRLGRADRMTAVFEVDEMCPAAGQGALAVEIRSGDRRMRELVGLLDHPPAHLAIRAERALLAALGGGCQVPIAAHAWLQGHQLHLAAMVARPDGTRLLRASAAGEIARPEALGQEVADRLLGEGARELLS